MQAACDAASASLPWWGWALLAAVEVTSMLLGFFGAILWTTGLHKRRRDEQHPDPA